MDENIKDEVVEEPVESVEIAKSPDDEFEVVIPKTEMVVMPAEPEAPQDAHHRSFTSFYVKQFKTDNLEVMDDYDVDNISIILNDFILNNQDFKRADLADKLLEIYLPQINQLLENIEAKAPVSPANFTAFSQWADWYEEIRATNKSALS